MRISRAVYLFLFFLLSLLFSHCNDDVELPYKTYSSLLSQEGVGNPTERILINDLGISIEWTRQAVGVYRGVLSKPVDLDETTLIIQLQQYNRIPTGGFIDPSTIEFHNCERFNLYDSRDGLLNAVIEIKRFN